MLDKLTSRPAAWWKNLVPRKRGLGLTAIAVSTALIAQGSVVTDASWNDTEWTHGTVGTLDCDDPQLALANRAAGRVLSGSLLGIDLDNVAEAKGVEATNNGSRSKWEPETAADLGSHAYESPLNVEALNAVEVDLKDYLHLPLNTDAGVLDEYAQARKDGEAVGAAGTVADGGDIALEYRADGSVPDIASVKLSTLLNSTELGLGDLLDGITDLELKIGAVAGRASMDGCDEMWGMAGAVDREYLTSHVDLDLTSTIVGTLGSTISNAVATLDNAAKGVVGDGGFLSAVTGELNTILGSLRGLINLVTMPLGVRIPSDADIGAVVTSIDLDLSEVTDLVDNPFGDEVVSIHLAEGLVSIDTVALVSEAYPDTYNDGLNGLSPNTNPLEDEKVLEVLIGRLGSTLGTLVSEIRSSLSGSIDKAHVQVQVAVPIQECTDWLLAVCAQWDYLQEPNTGLAIKIDGTLQQLRANNGDVVTADLSLLGALLPGIGDLLAGLGESIVEDVVQAGLLPAVGGLLSEVLTTVETLPPGLLEDLGESIVGLVGTLYDELFLAGVLSLTVNAQNDRQSEPHDWKKDLPEGRYDVAALRVGILDALEENGVWLYLGRGSVGPACSTVDLSATCETY